MNEFENYELQDYEAMQEFIVRTESLQAGLLGEWLISNLKPTNVVDVGCGPGIYLKPFADAGLTTWGIDGVEKPIGLPESSAYGRADIRLPLDLQKEKTYAIDPSKLPTSTKGIGFDYPFGLAICLEVAEHLGAEFSEVFIDNLCALSDTIVFSAATPGQGGTNHRNEQPTEYWAELFAKRGYVVSALQPQFAEWLKSVGEQYDGQTVSRWLVNHTIIYQKPTEIKAEPKPKAKKSVKVDVVEPIQTEPIAVAEDAG